MKASYDRNADALLIHVGKGKVDYAEEMGPFVIHFTKRGKPLLIEILDASEVLSSLTRITMRSKKAVPVQVAWMDSENGSLAQSWAFGVVHRTPLKMLVTISKGGGQLTSWIGLTGLVALALVAVTVKRRRFWTHNASFLQYAYRVRQTHLINLLVLIQVRTAEKTEHTIFWSLSRHTLNFRGVLILILALFMKNFLNDLHHANLS